MVDPTRNAPGVPRALARAAVSIVFPQSVILVCMGLISTGVSSSAPVWLMHVLGYSGFAMWAVMFSTARRPNGYAGFQDLATDTRVVLKSVYQTRQVLPSEEELPESTETTSTIGPYHVLSNLDKTGDGDFLLGYDTRLLRTVWIRTVPDDEPAVATELRELGRPGRLRWLAGKRVAGECWDAYEAPSGSSLVQLLKEPKPWERVRYWLFDLAEELTVGAKEQSLPAVLALDRVWITREGRAKLLDFSAPGAQEHGPWPELSPLADDDPASTRSFLNQVSMAALEGRAVEAEKACGRAVAVPLPLHARTVMGELPEIEGPEHFARRLKPLLGRTASVSRVRRLGLLAACIASLFLLAGIFVLGQFVFQQWLDEHSDIVPLHYCLKRMDKLERASDPQDDAQEQQHRALEVYVAGRFVGTISDPAVWSSSLAARLFSPNQRRIAEQALADHPDPSEKEVADAETRLRTFLDEMPDGLSGVNDGTIPLALFGMAVGSWLVLVGAPSVISALLFRGGLLMYIFGIAVVTKNGSRASRLRTLWRSLVTWSPCVLLPMLAVFLNMVGLERLWSMCFSLAFFTALIAWSALMPVRGLPDRIAGTYPVPR